MTNTTYLIVAAAVGILLSLIFAVIMNLVSKSKKDAASHDREALLNDAKREAEKIRREAAIEAKDIVYQAKSDIEKELKERRYELNHLDKRLRQKEENIDKKSDYIEKRERDLTRRERDFNRRENDFTGKEKDLEEIIQAQKNTLERISGLSPDQARAELLRRVEEESRFEAAKLLKQIEEETRELSQKKSREIISLAVQRYASDYVADVTVNSVTLPNDEMKGRIIGREGRNIRALEAATGVDFIVDDTRVELDPLNGRTYKSYCPGTVSSAT